MVQIIIISILFYLGTMVLFSLFLQGCTKNEKAFYERIEAEKVINNNNNFKTQL